MKTKTLKLAAWTLVLLALAIVLNIVFNPFVYDIPRGYPLMGVIIAVILFLAAGWVNDESNNNKI